MVSSQSCCKNHYLTKFNPQILLLKNSASKLVRQLEFIITLAKKSNLALIFHVGKLAFGADIVPNKWTNETSFHRDLITFGIIQSISMNELDLGFLVTFPSGDLLLASTSETIDPVNCTFTALGQVRSDYPLWVRASGPQGLFSRGLILSGHEQQAYSDCGVAISVGRELHFAAMRSSINVVGSLKGSSKQIKNIPRTSPDEDKHGLKMVVRTPTLFFENTHLQAYLTTFGDPYGDVQIKTIYHRPVTFPVLVQLRSEQGSDFSTYCYIETGSGGNCVITIRFIKGIFTVNQSHTMMMRTAIPSKAYGPFFPVILAPKRPLHSAHGIWLHLPDYPVQPSQTFVATIRVNTNFPSLGLIALGTWLLDITFDPIFMLETVTSSLYDTSVNDDEVGLARLTATLKSSISSNAVSGSFVAASLRFKVKNSATNQDYNMVPWEVHITDYVTESSLQVSLVTIILHLWISQLIK